MTLAGYTVELRSAAQDRVYFPCSPRQSILRAASNAGFDLSAGCMQGRCYTCRSRLLAGSVTNVRQLSRYATVDPADLGDGRVLLCSVTPATDVVIVPEGPWTRRG